MTATQLFDWFIALKPEAYVVKGRDIHMLSQFLRDRGMLSSQLLEGMTYDDWSKSIPQFLASNLWLLEDVLLQEADLVAFLTGESPSFYQTYRDLKDTGMPSAQQEAAFSAAKEQLERWVNDALDQPARSPNHLASQRAIQRAKERVA